MFERILVPLDGSKLAEQVLPPIAGLARIFHSEVVLINVCESEETKGGQACSLYMQTEADRLKGDLDASAKVKTEILLGKPDTKILNYAQTGNINLIAMSSHGASGLMAWSLGGTVTKVLHKAGVPLIIIRAKEELAEKDKAPLFRKMLIPLDGSERAAKVLPYAAEIASRVDCEVILLNVIETGRHVHTLGGIDYLRYTDIDIKKMRESAREYLQKAGSVFKGTKAKISYEVKEGNSAREIIKLANEKDISLIALSSHGHSGLEAWIVGSVTYKILQASDKSILFVPALET